jgi:uncharacterized integral membrane protein (TIGR02327 family)
MGGEFAQQAIVSMIVQLAFIAITWWALQSLKIDALIRSGKVVHARVLIILLTIAIGSIVGNFFLDYLFWSQQLKYLF